jgi:putative glutamine amidotransferase
MSKPIILISTSNAASAKLSSITGDTEIIYSDKATAAAIIQAGGLPLYLPSISATSPELVAECLELVDGVLLTGADTNVNPAYYNESPMYFDRKNRMDDERDQVDMLLTRLAYERKIPTTGICKGMQILNVGLGGTLYQDLASQCDDAIDHDPRESNRANLTHTVKLANHSLLRTIFAEPTVRINSSHQQAIKKLAGPLRPTAVSSDAIVEAYEGTSHPFLLGVQFHPELRTFDPPFLRIFEQFMAASARYHDTKTPPG